MTQLGSLEYRSKNYLAAGSSWKATRERSSAPWIVLLLDLPNRRPAVQWERQGACLEILNRGVTPSTFLTTGSLAAAKKLAATH
jgi:hypothetical protein